MAKAYIGAAIATLCLLAAAAGAAPVRVGSAMKPYHLEDQFGNAHNLAPDTRAVIISSEMSVSKTLHDWLTQRGGDFLPSRKTEYVSDITGMPAPISVLFAQPKMRKYPFRILLAHDQEFGKEYPKEEGKLAVFLLDEDQNVSDIRFISAPEELEALLPPASEQPTHGEE